MKIFAISDLHLSSKTDKPMNIFGNAWENHWGKIKEDWCHRVDENDIVLIAGDISWGMNLEQAIDDLYSINVLPGKKIIIRGNHDYWWGTYKKLQALDLENIYFLQNNARKIGNYIFCGTRGWTVPENKLQSDEDLKIFEREKIRLKLSLEEAHKLKENEENQIIGLIHYPPFNSKFEKSYFTELFTSYNVKTIVYGHLHGQQSRYKNVVEIEGCKYYLTSCDFLNNELLLL